MQFTAVPHQVLLELTLRVLSVCPPLVLADNVASHMKPTLPDGPQEPAADSVQRIVRQAVVKVADSLNSTSSSSSALSQASLAQKTLNNTIYGATH